VSTAKDPEVDFAISLYCTYYAVVTWIERAPKWTSAEKQLINPRMGKYSDEYYA